MLTLRKNRGFTLIEVLIALALVAILGTMAVPAFQHWTQNTQIRNAAEGILNGMQIARGEAVHSNTPIQIILNSGSGWTIAAVATPTTIIQQRDAGDGSRVASVAVLPAGADRVTFNGMGWLTTNNNGSNSITQIDITSSISSGTEIRPLRLVINSGGAMKMCDPAVATSDPRACP